MKLTSLVAVLCGLTLSMQSHALGERTDYDLDNNGLIEINDLADLNEIRNDLTGASLYGSSAGCPTTGCIGFELTTDLDFDTNGDGLMNAEDTYWNSGSGWVPLGSSSTPFTAVFEGNGYNIRNLYINSSSSYRGLFGYLSNTQVTNVGITGPLVYIRGYDNTGILAGRALNSQISGIHISGRVLASSSSTYYLGGIVGYLDKSQLERSIASVQVSGASYSGGLVGYANNSQLTSVVATGLIVGNYSYTGGLVGYSTTNSRITHGLSTVVVTGTSSVGGLIGFWSSSILLTNTYWATDVSQQSESGGTGGVGATVAQLACPTAGDNTECTPGVTLYEGWGESINAQGEPLWDFGIAGQLPGLRLNGVVYRDSDNDGVLDIEDAFPNNRAASIDTDGDGYPDRWELACDQACRDASGLVIDQFPHNPAAHLDADFDGFPDAWNPDCDSSCQSASGLELDLYPNDADNNGIIDSLEENRVDKNGNGLIEISTLAELNAIRFQLQGRGLQLSANDTINTIGCPAIVDEDGVLVRGCRGYELTQDLDFDTNGDGLMNAEDTYWNNGSGWSPLGYSSVPFSAAFEGNGYNIRNLYINSSSSYNGLFGYLSNAQVTNVGITGPLVYIRGHRSTGILAGQALNSRISGVYASGRVLASHSDAYYFGGIVGLLENSQLERSIASVQVSGGYYSGGLTGYASGSQLTSVVATGSVVGSNGYTGGLIGNSVNSSRITHGLSSSVVRGTSSVGGVVGYASTALLNTYWATDFSQQSESGGTGGVGATVAQLACPITADDTDCASGITLYEGWGELTNTQGEPLWDFGIAGQLPGLRLHDVVYRDSDNDGVFDIEDTFPNNRAASIDTDGDGYPDRWNPECNQACRDTSGLTIDQFPNNPAAHLDADFDGFPEAWNPDCDSSCQSASGLELDLYPNDADNNGIIDSLEENRADKDGNGLIEISTLAELNVIRFQLQGYGLKLSANDSINTIGCPSVVDEVGNLVRRCRGYELTQNLDFDTNGDGLMNAEDTYWNNGSGWSPLGSSSVPFSAVFEGNGYNIRNLYINSSSSYRGLFGYLSNTQVTNVGITGPLVYIRGYDNTGILAGRALNSHISAVHVSGRVLASSSSTYYLGGIVGYLDNSQLERSIASVQVSGASYSGGLVGYADNSQLTSVMAAGPVVGSSSYTGGLVGYSTTNSRITHGLSTVVVTGTSSMGGVIGFLSSSILLTNTYWATDVSQQSKSGGTGGVGATVAQLACPTAGDNTECTPGVTLYEGWGESINAQGEPLWDFGIAGQLPGLRLHDVVYRDSDNDGVFDIEDAFPNNRAASIDTDGDGYPDRWELACDQACRDASGLTIDQFPNNPAAHLDADFDGFPEAWNPDCDSSCQSASGLELDLYPNDADNNGVIDSLDENSADKDGNGLIDISTLTELNAIRFQLQGYGLQLSANDSINTIGCPSFLDEVGTLVRRCRGYELTQNLDFDTNGDGLMNAEDAYWNSGSGWVPLGSSSVPFTAVFEGNGYNIRNLYINSSSSYRGLFGYLSNTQVTNVGITGPLVYIRGYDNNGILAGRADNSHISAVHVSGRVLASSSSDRYIGGIVGYLDNSQLERSIASVQVSGTSFLGGLVGYAINTQLTSVMATGSVVGSGAHTGGLIGRSFGNTRIVNGLSTSKVSTTALSVGGLIGSSSVSNLLTNTYWATDASQQSQGGSIWATSDSQQSQGGSPGGVGATFAQLACPITANNIDCASGVTLYEGWGELTNAQGEPLWDFGIAGQLPGLRLKGVVYRDSDNDGVFDIEDAFPNNRAASIDRDGDGLPDTWNASCDAECQTNSGLVLDAFPLNAAASIDTDGDGAPDAWNESCDAECQANSGLVLDGLPLNAAAAIDTDGDGAPDAWNSSCDAECQTNSGLVLDAFPLNAAASIDTDGDGALDAWNESCDADCQTNSGLVLDNLPLNAAASIDTDGDGVPDAWNESCDAECQANSGLVLDAFPLNAAASIDTDGDGAPDAWNESCDAECQTNSGLVLDNLPLNAAALIDTDGDGAPDAWNESCDAECQANSGLVLDAFPLNAAAAIDTDGDGAPDAWNESCDADCQTNSGLVLDNLPLNAAASIDTDGDGAPDAWNESCDAECQANSGLVLDAFPLNAAAAIDTDGDGAPDAWNESCDADCQTNSGLVLDNLPLNAAAAIDTDGDGAPDAWNESCDAECQANSGLVLDGLPLNAAASIDTDGDGAPDAWNESCDAECQANSGLVLDAFPLNAAASIDTDGDGAPDAWNESCDAECQANSGLVLDAFPLNAAASIDTDGDGAPDAWNESCDAECQTNSGLVLDNLPLNAAASIDTDGDGAPDAWNESCDADCQTNSGLVLDNLPLNAAAAIDTDGDGAPDAWNESCDADCQTNSGLVLDNLPLNAAASIDTDGDGAPDAWNESCDAECQANSGLVLDAFPLNAAASIDTDGDGAPDAWNESCDADCQANSGLVLDNLPLNAAASIDTDGDGAPDAWNESCDAECQANSGLVLDAFPLNAAASIDTDGDGAPDAWNESCDADCQANSGLVLDNLPLNAAASIDTDGDGAPDAWNESCDAECQANSGLVLDAFPLNAAASIDTDGDGAPDVWNESCDAECQANSGLVLDAFPLNAAASIDTDGDGAPDAWNESCDVTCQTNSSLVLDAFPLNAAASIDLDGDGRPDAWNASCNAECQLSSGLVLDAYPNDGDNDGVPDNIDPDNTRDNGIPLLQAVPEDLVLHATGTLTPVTLNTGALLAWDVVDSASELRFEVSLNGRTLTIDEQSNVSLPSGHHRLSWVAIDRAGNQSEPLTQSVVIYPTLGFAQEEMVTGEGSVVRIPLVFSGPSPMYPVVIRFQWEEALGDVSREDFDESVDLDDLQLTIADEDALAEAALLIALLEDNQDEANENLVLSIASVIAGDDSVALNIDENGANKTVVVTDENLAPTVSLIFEHQGVVQTFTSATMNEVEIDLYSGEFQLDAVVEDPNGRDTHRYTWNLGQLPHQLGEADTQLRLDPINLVEGDYELALQVTDSGVPNLTSNIVSVRLRIFDATRSSSTSSNSSASSDVSSASSSSSSKPVTKKKKSGGSSNGGLLLLLVLLGLLVALSKRRTA